MKIKQRLIKRTRQILDLVIQEKRKKINARRLKKELKAYLKVLTRKRVEI